MSKLAPPATCPMGTAKRVISCAGRTGLLLAALLVLGAGAADACRYQRGLFLQQTSSWQPQCAHPLCGAIHATDAARLNQSKTSCDGDAYYAFRRDTHAAIQKGGFVLFGEVHDNAQQHRMRAAWLSDLLIRTEGERARRPAAVFEHIRRDQQQGLTLFTEMSRNGQHMASASNLFRFLKWETSGWPGQAMFEPLFAAVIANRLAIIPGEPARADVRKVSLGGLEGIAEGERKRLHLGMPLEAALQDALLGELEASHCGLVPKAAFATMAQAQRFRDAHQAAALAEAAKRGSGAILFAGNGHVRSDRGVPYYLRQMAPEHSIVAVLALEVEDGKTDPAAYVPRGPDGTAAADYIVFTPRVQRKDPCTEMREQFKRRPEKQ